MPAPFNQDRNFNRLVMLATYVLVTAILWVAKDVLMPVAVAGLLAFLLSPGVARLMRWGLSKMAAIVVTVLLATSIVGVLAAVVAWQGVDMAEQLPRYERNIRAKIELVRKPPAPESLSRTSEMIEHLRSELKSEPKADGKTAGKKTTETARPEEPKPVPVEVHEPDPTAFELARAAFRAVAGPLGVAGVVIVLMVVILIQAEDLRDRLIQAVSAGRINIATQALEDAARRVSRYLLLQLVVNASYGIPVGIGLFLIGIPGAALWGLLATVLRFIPFIGPWIAASFPVVLSLAVDPGWTMALWTLGLYVTMELISNNIIEVWLYGSGTGISNFALLVGAVFWTWLWGPMGLVLATPLTVCLLVLGRHVPGLKVLGTLLGSEPVLEPPAQFYQRMLSMDADRMMDLAADYIGRNSLAGFYDDVFLPALILAEEDRHAGALAEVRQQFILEAGRELIEALEQRDADAAEPAAQVVGLPAGDDADELAGLMLRHLLRERGIGARVEPITAPVAEVLARARTSRAPVVFVSALPPSAVSAARRMCRQVARAGVGAPLLVGVWSRRVDPVEVAKRLDPGNAPVVSTRLADAAVQIANLAAGGREPERPAENGAGPEPLGLERLEPEGWVDAVSRDLARAFDVPLSLVAVTDVDVSYWRERVPMPADKERMQDVAREMGAGGRMEEGLQVVADTAGDRKLAQSAFLKERGVRFFAGVELRTPGGRAVARLCVVDTEPRELGEDGEARLRARAAELMAVAEARGDAGRPGGGALSYREVGSA